jgi:dienelactone hydrolase
MTTAAADWQLHVYGGVGHSFTDTSVDAMNYPGFRYDARANQRSWAAMSNLFGETWGTPHL